MSNKTPFELRFDILSMANDFLEKTQATNMEFATKAFKIALEQGKATADEWQKFTPVGYTFADILKKSEELYSFVNKGAK